MNIGCINIETKRKYKIRVRTQQCPCFKKNHSRLYSSKVPRTVLCSYGTGEEQSCPLSQEKILTWTISTSLQIRNGSSVRTAWFQVNFRLKIFQNIQQKKDVYCIVDTTVSRDGRQEFSCRRACQKKSKVNSYCLRVTNTGSSTSHDPAEGMISVWTEFSM